MNSSPDSEILFSFSVRNRLQRPHLDGNKLGKLLSSNSIAALDFDSSLKRFVLPVALTEGIS